MATVETLVIPPAAIADATPAQAAEVAAPVVEAKDAPAQDQSLADAIKAHMDSIRAAAANVSGRTPQAEAEIAEEATTTEEPAAAVEEPAKVEAEPVAEVAAEPAKEEPAKVDPEDAIAARLAQYVRDSNRVRKEQASLRAEREAFAREQEALKTEREALARFNAAKARDPLEAIEELVGKDALSGDLFVRALNKLSAQDPATMSEEDKQALLLANAERAVLAKLEEKRKADEAATAKAAAEQNEANKEQYFLSVDATFKANRHEYKYLAADPVSTDDMDRAVVAHFSATGVRPSPEMVLSHFNNLQKAKAERLAKVLNLVAPPAAPVPAPKVPAPVAPKPTRLANDSKGRPPTAGKPLDYRQQRDEIAARLDMQEKG